MMRPLSGTFLGDQESGTQNHQPNPYRFGKIMFGADINAVAYHPHRPAEKPVWEKEPVHLPHEQHATYCQYDDAGYYSAVVLGFWGGIISFHFVLIDTSKVSRY